MAKSKRNGNSRRLLAYPEVVAKTGLSRQKIARLMQLQAFPRPIGGRRHGVPSQWYEADVDAWLRWRRDFYHCKPTP
jgi:predicted DNA-binding transcriptional regulator AlpA